VENVVAVKVVDRIKCLDEDAEGLGLGESVIVGLVVKQVSFIGILHYQIDPIQLLQDIPQSHDMWMI
jgi:hypothetical protein